MADILHIDFETTSTVDLRKCGVHAYARHPDTRVLCLGYAFNDEPVENFDGMHPPDVYRIDLHVRAGGLVAAWNALFEFEIWNQLIPLGMSKLILGQMVCTQAMALYVNLPASLDQAAGVFPDLPKKDMDGHKLMMQLSKPRSYHPFDGPVWWHEDMPDRLDRLKEYCKRDVEVERQLHQKLNPLPDKEMDIWQLNARMNSAGIPVDLDLVEKLEEIVDTEMTRLNQRLETLTDGKVTSSRQTAKLMGWLYYRGSDIPNLQRQTVMEYLEPLRSSPILQSVLEIRLQASKSSTAKLARFRQCAVDGKLHGTVQYYGASRTGRFAGRLAQPHNFPRPTIDKPAQAIGIIQAGAGHGGVRSWYEKPIEVVASCLRGCIVAPPDHQLCIVDFSQIEARILAWLCGQADILEAFKKGQDVYTLAAAKIGSNDRFLGKVLTLACGYGMGADKFHGTAAQYGLAMSLEECKNAVSRWRDTNKNIVKAWRTIDRLFQTATVTNVNTLPYVATFRQGVRFSRPSKDTIISLPSDRTLTYRNTCMVDGELQYDTHRTARPAGEPAWGSTKTYGAKLIENIVQALARDCLTDAMLAMDQNRLDIRLTVHDEIIVVSPTHMADDALTVMLKIMHRSPEWASDLPMGAEGWVTSRYGKA